MDYMTKTDCALRNWRKVCNPAGVAKRAGAVLPESKKAASGRPLLC